jgi:hypothetical protein
MESVPDEGKVGVLHYKEPQDLGGGEWFPEVGLGGQRGFQLKLQRQNPAAAHLIRQTPSNRPSIATAQQICSAHSQDMQST